MTAQTTLVHLQFEAFCTGLPYDKLTQTVQIVHEDGSLMVFHHAALWESEEGMECLPDIERKGWIGVCTEHCGDHLFHAADLVTWRGTPTANTGDSGKGVAAKSQGEEAPEQGAVSYTALLEENTSLKAENARLWRILNAGAGVGVPK